MPRNDEFLYMLRNANPIETVMGSYVQLIRRGRNYVCSCPFHSEKTPSCTVFTRYAELLLLRLRCRRRRYYIHNEN